MKEIYELSKKELVLLQYYILRESYNYVNPASQTYQTYYEQMADYVKQNSIKNGFALKTWIVNFAKYEKIIYLIILNQNYDNELLKQLELGNHSELYAVMEKLLFIFSVNKSENIDIYNRIQKVVHKLYVPSLKDIFVNLSNPFDNLEFVSKVNGQLKETSSIEVRNIYLSNDKRRDDKYLTTDDMINLAKMVIQDNVEYFFHKFMAGDTTLIPNLQEYKKIKLYIENNLELLAKEFSVEFAYSGVDIDKLCSNISDKYLRTFIKEIHSQFGFIYEEHFGRSYFGDSSRLRYPLKDVRIYVNTSFSKYGFMFLNEYIKKCRSYGIDYDMKGMDKGYGYEGKDQTIFYTLLSEVPIRTKILDEIKEEHPEWINSFGLPPLACGKVNNSYYGISHIGVYSLSSTVNELEEYFGFQMCGVNKRTYNDYINWISMSAYYSTLASFIVESPLINSIDSKYKTVIQKFARLQDVKRDEGEIGNVLNATIDGITIEKLIYYFRDKNFVAELSKLGYSCKDEKWLKRLQKRMQGLANIVQGFKINAHISPAISEFIRRKVRESEMGENNTNMYNSVSNGKKI